MNQRLRLIVMSLSAIALFVSLATWAGVAATPRVGPLAFASAGREAPLALLYMHAGSWIAGHAGLDAAAARFAERRLGSAYPRVEAAPAAAMDILLDAMPGPTRASHSGLPLLLIAWALLWFLRPRQVETIRRK